MLDHDIPIYGRRELTSVYDCALQPVDGGWTAGNDMAGRLLRCLEAVRDLDAQVSALLQYEPSKRPMRLVKSLVIPLFTLFELLTAMLNFLRNDRREQKQLTAAERNTINVCLTAFETLGLIQKGDLKLVRDKIGAHVDGAPVITSRDVWQKIDIRKFMDWGIVMLAALSQVLCMKIFVWTELGTPENVWNLMSVDGAVLHLRRLQEPPECDGDFPWAISAIELAYSPKITISNELLAAREKCLALIGFFPEDEMGAGQNAIGLSRNPFQL